MAASWPFPSQQRFSPAADGPLPTGALCSCKGKLQAALWLRGMLPQTTYCSSRSAVTGSLSFCCFFWLGIFRVGTCYCQSLKAGRRKKGWPPGWLSLRRLLQACQVKQGFQRRKSLSAHFFLKSASYFNIREHLKVAARAAAVPSTALRSEVFLPERAGACDGN